MSAVICGHCGPWLLDIPRNYIFMIKKKMALTFRNIHHQSLALLWHTQSGLSYTWVWDSRPLYGTNVQEAMKKMVSHKFSKAEGIHNCTDNMKNHGITFLGWTYLQCECHIKFLHSQGNFAFRRGSSLWITVYVGFSFNFSKVPLDVTTGHKRITVTDK
jgi:hypothetical protein